MQQRITGFDMARAYAIFGMFIVNFNYAFGSFTEHSAFGIFLNFFVGKSTAIFIVLAGMGLSFMALRNTHTPTLQKQLRSVVLRRSWFLFTIGLLLFLWWPGDILHFYGAYMHIAAFVLFVNKKYYLLLAALIIGIYHLLLLVIPVDTGWDFSIFQPTGFWTAGGFIRNTFYNGWNPVFPWFAYFALGMWLGRLNWNNSKTKWWLFFTGLCCFMLVYVLRHFTLRGIFSDGLSRYILSEYFPPYLPFMLSTAGFALAVIVVCMWTGERFKTSGVVQWISAAGSMTLTHYVLHLTLGVFVFSALTGIAYTGFIQTGMTASPLFIFLFSLGCFVFCVTISAVWKRKFRNGPLEGLMRWISG